MKKRRAQRYAVHPGAVDGARVPAHSIAALHLLKPHEWIEWDTDRPSTWKGRKWDDYIHLFPRVDGKYPAKEAS